ncbi:MAG: hypothetical protein M1376_01610 [Planctomycetes bacterium]|nr:hypothetical protein [Planctomycetota bacterium]
MFENEHDFQRLVKGLKLDDQPNPAHRERLRGQMLQAFAQAGGQRVGCVSRTIPAPAQGGAWYAPYRLAVAATVLVVATVGIWALVGRGPVTLRQVRLATQKAAWLYAVVSRYQGPEVRTERHWYDFAAQKGYAVLDDGGVVGWDYGGDAKKLLYSPRVKALMISDLSNPGAGGDSTENLMCVFAVFAARDDVKGAAAQYDGKTVRSFEIEKAESGLNIDGKAVRLLKATMMADPRTRRLLAAGIEYQGSDGGVLVREGWTMSYPPSGPASVYDLGVPTMVARIDGRRQRIGTPSAEPMPIPTPAPTGSFRLAPVEIRLPRPMFAGTPEDARLPNLERPRSGPRPPFLAPVGTTNVALGKPVSSGEEPVIGSLEAITDGDKEAAEGSFVELSPGPQFVTIDLQERCEIDAVVVWHYHRWPRAYVDVVVQVSDDPAFQTAVKTIFNNDTDNSLGLGAGGDLSYVETYEGKLIEGKGAQGRYVRLFSNGNTRDDLNHYIEVEVYGRPL